MHSSQRSPIVRSPKADCRIVALEPQFEGAMPRETGVTAQRPKCRGARRLAPVAGGNETLS